MIVIKTTKKDLFYNYLHWLDPVLNLSENERKVLAAFLSLHYAYREYNPVTLNELLFSPETKADLAKRLGLNTSKFNKAFHHLEEKELIKDNQITPYLTKHPRDANFKISVQFILEDKK